jgi:hypothetical protein
MHSAACVRRVRLRADFVAVNCCREVSTLMRYLGAYPSEKEIIKEILPEVRNSFRGLVPPAGC